MRPWWNAKFDPVFRAQQSKLPVWQKTQSLLIKTFAEACVLTVKLEDDDASLDVIVVSVSGC